MNWLTTVSGPLMLILRVFGGLGMFLFGMQTMSEGIRKRSGDRSQRLVQSLTSSPAAGILTGTGITAVIQSSSATTVVLVSMVNAGLIGLRESIAVIMGANIGTTFTAWIVSFLGFNVTIANFALPAIALSIPFHFSKREQRKNVALILLGFGLLFLGLDAMKIGVSVLEKYPVVPRLLQIFPEQSLLSRVLFIGLGTLLTIAVQSSSAAMTITLTLVYMGWIPFSLAAAIVLGENIGTTITAYLASMEMSTQAKRCARSHLLFNLFGVLWMFFLLKPALYLVDAVIPGSPGDPLATLYHLSAFHTLFNGANTLLLVWFIPQIEKAVSYLIPEPEELAAPSGEIPWVRENLPEAQKANIINAQGAVMKLSGQIKTLSDYVMNSLDPSLADENLPALIAGTEHSIVSLEKAILSHLSECALESLTEEQAQWVAARLRIISEFERIGNGLIKIFNLGQKIGRKKNTIHDDARNQILEISYPVRDFLEYISTLLEQQPGEIDLSVASSMEEEINKFRDKLNKISRKSIKSGSSIKGELLFMEVVRRFENLGDSCIGIARELSR